MEVNFPIYVVDAFTDTPFQGNPAGICLLLDENNKNGDGGGGYDLTDKQMLQIAKEMKHSETSFVQKIREDGKVVAGVYRLRWFTPTTEVKLCGHATLGTAKVLFQEIHNEDTSITSITFKTLSGDLIVTKNGDLFQMQFPQGFCSPLTLHPNILSDLTLSLGIPTSSIIAISFDSVSGKLIVELDHINSILDARVNMEKIISINFPVSVRGVSISTSNLKHTDFHGKFDFASRYFAPWVGIPEDPVNGSSHTILAGYYSEKLKKDHLLAYMASERSGVLGVRVAENQRVILEGRAVLTLKGTLKARL